MLTYPIKRLTQQLYLIHIYKIHIVRNITTGHADEFY